MIRTSRLLGFGLLAAVAMLSMLAIACGDDDSTSTATAPAAATSAPTKPAEATKAPASPAAASPAAALACASPAASAAAASPAAGAGPTVIVADYSYSPLTLTVAKGTTVTWQWSGPIPHQVAGNFEGQYVRSPELTGGCTWTFTFNTPGTYPYACPIHGTAHKPGTIIVEP
jgi:plastocyanin